MEKKAPFIFVAAGGLMLFTAVYIAGVDHLSCRRAADVSCDIVRFHWLGRRAVETVHVQPIVDTFVRTSESRRDWTSPAGRHNETTTNETLIAHTASGADVELIGGEGAGPVWDQLHDLIAGRSQEPIEYVDSFWPMAYALGGFGLVFVAFGVIARVVEGG